MEVYGSTDAGVDEAPGGEPPGVRGPGVPEPDRPQRHALPSPPASRARAGLVMDAAGRIVRHLGLRAGEPALSWDCADDAGLPVPGRDVPVPVRPQSGKVEVVR